MTALGVYRRLQTLSTEDGHFNILAIDHRDALRAALHPDAPERATDDHLVAIKLRLASHLAGMASAVMLEPEFSMAQTIASGMLPPTVGYTAAIEAQGYLADPTVVTNSTLPGWSVAQAALAGASAAKILVLWDPTDGAAQRAQLEWIASLVEECAKYALPLLVEPIIRGGAEFELHVEMVATIAELGPTILKLAIPPGEHRFELLDRAARPHPWVLLSAGVSFDTFVGQVREATLAGASGFAVGRALWGEYVRSDGDPADLVAVMRQRLRTLCDVTAESATPWTDRVPAPRSDPDWFRARSEA